MAAVVFPAAAAAKAILNDPAMATPQAAASIVRLMSEYANPAS
ncbi:MAG TPA: hypothetical protein VFV19_16970 [Candidatus Polarisedimenticolaceae bacterium]|nr:hypothetical protein [Candidatus Polarisedimenticolaceae bacterium]